MKNKSSFLILTFLSLFISNALAEEVNVYSYRQEFLVKPLFDIFTEQTGIKVNTVFAKKGMIERLKLEGDNSPADIILTVDIGRLTDAVKAGVTQTVDNEIINNNIPSQYRDPENHWFGLTTRARLIVVSKERINQENVKSYQDLADPKFRGKVCTRSGKHAYMVALTASVIANNGHEAAQNWLQGVKENLARKPQGNDRGQVKAIKEGECDIALINSYYMGKMLNDEKGEQQAWANSVHVIFPNQDKQGSHVNVSGMALTKSSPNKPSAIKLMAFLSSDQAQEIYAQVNHEYPVKAGVPWSKEVLAWGKFKADDLSLAEIANNRSAASKLVDIVSYDQ